MWTEVFWSLYNIDLSTRHSASKVSDRHTELCSVFLCFSLHILSLPSHVLRLNKQNLQAWMS